MGRVADWEPVQSTPDKPCVMLPTIALTSSAVCWNAAVQELCRGRLRQLAVLQQAEAGHNLAPHHADTIPRWLPRFIKNALIPWARSALRSDHAELGALRRRDRASMRRNLQLQLKALVDLRAAALQDTSSECNARCVADVALFAYVHSVLGCTPGSNKVSKHGSKRASSPTCTTHVILQTLFSPSSSILTHYTQIIRACVASGAPMAAAAPAASL